MNWKVLAGIVVSLALATSANAALEINVGDHDLNADQGGQIVYLYVSDNGVQVQACFLRAQIGDGDPAETTPVFESDETDLEVGIFAANNDGQNDQSAGLPDQLTFWEISTDTGTVTVSGMQLLATVTVDTTGLTTGTWPLKLKDLEWNGAAAGSTEFDVSVTITNGSITIIPEPASMALIALGGVALLRRRRR